jgi:hypothetical protein
MSSKSWRIERDPAEGGRETIEEALGERDVQRKGPALRVVPSEQPKVEEVVADPEGAEGHLKTPAA